jgi:hypothetical protein
MNIIDFGHGIKGYENFVTPEELAIIQAACRDPKFWEGPKGGINRNELFENNVLNLNEDHGQLQKIVESFNERIHKTVGNDKIRPTYGMGNIQRMRTSDADRLGMNVSMQLHHDKFNPWSILGVVIYFNDDFEEGEIEYLDLGIRIKPRAGMMLCHPSELVHFVNKVKGGDRFFTTNYVMENFHFHGRKELPEKEYKEIMHKHRTETFPPINHTEFNNTFKRSNAITL